MDTATQAATVVDSAPASPEPINLSALTPEQRSTWREKGELPKAADSAPAKKDETKEPPADSATAKDSTTDAAGAEPAKESQEYKARTEKRFTEVLDKVKRLETELAEAKKPRETKADPQPAAKADEYKPLDEAEFYAKNPNATVKDFEREEARHEARWAVQQELKLEKQKEALAAAQKEMTDKFEDVKKRYPDADQKVFPALKSIYDDPAVPLVVKQLVNDSPVLVDLMYVLGGDAAGLKDLIETAKTNPAAAIRKLNILERLTEEELGKAKAGKETAAEGTEKAADAKDGAERDESGKFVKKVPPVTPITSAQKPPSEVGGRGTAVTDPVEAAARATPGKLTREYKDQANREFLARKH